MLWLQLSFRVCMELGKKNMTYWETSVFSCKLILHFPTHNLPLLLKEAEAHD